MESRYDPHAFEDTISALWAKVGFRAEVREGQKPFTIMMPPPNVTGSLHIGHALDFSIQDALSRFHRMRGDATLWLPGTDHAGIATQAKVEQKLREEGRDRKTMGREAFLSEVFSWKEKYLSEILLQMRRLGVSADFSRLRFTMDEGLSKAVRKAFVRYHDSGLIYRGSYITNWCPSCGTGISDIEVEHQTEAGKLWEIGYPLQGGDGVVPVATTRPETLFGDTAVAVHPEDPRYRAHVGSFVLLPLAGRAIPVVADEHVDPSFGTGAVKVTPAHDPNDFEIGQRHGLEHKVIMDEAGHLTGVRSPYDGMERFAAREKVVQDLKAQGLLRQVTDHEHAVGHCSRCDTVIEPLESTQWFVRMKPLAEPALEAARDGRVRFFPERFHKVYSDWLENIRDWCISRQLWWGHRIPAWYCERCGEMTVSEGEVLACPSCGGPVHQDEGVLDTWFSSGLWPFSTLGWPEQTEDLSTFYPTTVLVTGYDIIFFWVARMIFQALSMTGQVPFRDVVLHGLVRDNEGRKMSKSLGNGVDPNEVIDRFGADALRYALLTGTTPGQDLRFSEERVIEGRNFCNKLWNACRFVIGHLDGPIAPEGSECQALSDRWLRTKLSRAIEAAGDALLAYELGEAGRVTHEALWATYCDVYLELAKPRLATDEAPVVRRQLLSGLTCLLKLLHPFVPFVTEALWQALPSDLGTLAHAPWPTAGEIDEQAEAQMERLLETVRVIRNLKAEAGIALQQPVGLVAVGGQPFLDEVAAQAPLVDTLAHAGIAPAASAPRGSFSGRVPDGELFLPLAGVVDIGREIVRVQKEVADLQSAVQKSAAKLANPEFVKKAPPEVVEKEQGRHGEALSKLEKAQRRLALLGEA